MEEIDEDKTQKKKPECTDKTIYCEVFIISYAPTLSRYCYVIIVVPFDLYFSYINKINHVFATLDNTFHILFSEGLHLKPSHLAV